VCGTAADCRLRTVDCCECGGGMGQEDLIAIALSQEPAFAALACDPNVACADCAPVYPADVGTDCVNGHCVVVWWLPD
jgi:hypothetical protein